MSKKLQEQTISPTEGKPKHAEKITEFQSMYSLDELKGLLSHIRAGLKKQEKPKSPVGFMLASPGHRMFIGFNPDKNKWLFFDANQMPAKVCKNSKAAAKAIIKGFSSSKNGFATFNMEAWAFTHKKDHQLKSIFDELKKHEEFTATQKVTEEKAHRVDAKGNTWLFSATKYNDREIVRKLLQEGKADVNHLNMKGRCPLSYVFSLDDPDIAEQILQAGADPNIIIGEDKFAKPLLLAAIKHQRLDYVELLLKHKVDSRIFDKDGNSPLYLAVGAKDYKLTKILLEGGADPNFFETIQGESPLFLAVSEKMPEFIELLLKHGADPSIKEGMMFSPQELAKKQGGQPMLPLFEKPQATNQKQPAKPLIDNPSTLKAKK